MYAQGNSENLAQGNVPNTLLCMFGAWIHARQNEFSMVVLYTAYERLKMKSPEIHQRRILFNSLDLISLAMLYCNQDLIFCL